MEQLSLGIPADILRFGSAHVLVIVLNNILAHAEILDAGWASPLSSTCAYVTIIDVIGIEVSPVGSAT